MNSNRSTRNNTITKNDLPKNIENNLLFKSSLIPMLSIKNIIEGITSNVFTWIVLLLIVGFIFIV